MLARPLRVAVLSHTYIVRANRGKLESLARLPGVDLLLIVPKKWMNRDIGQRFRVESSQDEHLPVAAVDAWSRGSGSLITYSPLALWKLLRRFRPDLVHLEEEPWSFAALEVCFLCQMLGIPFIFFTWENIDKPLFFPFRVIRRWVLRMARAAVVGNEEAERLLKQHGFSNAVTVLPQLGVDTMAFGPAAVEHAFTIGYVGRLVSQKGLFVLLQSVARLSPDVQMMIVGSGPIKDELLAEAHTLGIDNRLHLHEGVRHHEVPVYLQQMSVLVLPSLTTPTWKEQFGHVLVEAMACGVVVVGSDSGAIPEVIGDAGIVFPENDVEALAAALQSLISAPARRNDLAARGRARVLAEYTNEIVASRLAEFWGRLGGRGA